MAADNAKIYWDSCVFIDGLRKTPARIAAILELESEAKVGRLMVYSSALAIAEVVRQKDYGELSEEELREISSYFRHKFIRIIPVDRIVAKNAAEIVRNHGLKPPDSIHIATAIRARCEVMYTYDGNSESGLLSKNGLIGVPAMPIKRPGEYGQMSLASSQGVNP